MAGVHLLPLLISMAFGKTLSAAATLFWPNSAAGSFVGGVVSSKKNNTSPTLISAGCFTLLGCGLLSTLGGGKEFYKPTYGYQVILGLGVGLTFSSVTVLTNINSKSEHIGMYFGSYILWKKSSK